MAPRLSKPKLSSREDWVELILVIALGVFIFVMVTAVSSSRLTGLVFAIMTLLGTSLVPTGSKGSGKGPGR